MVHAEYAVLIDRPIADVFAFLADGLNDPRWREGIVSIERISDTTGVGAMYRQVVHGLGGTRVDSDYFISDYEPPRLLGFEVTSGPVRPVGHFELSEAGPASTRVRSILDVATTGAMRFMTPMITREFDREVRQIERLKQVMEAKAA